MTMPKKHVDVVFTEPESAGPRPWGEETIVCIIPGIMSLKHLFIKKGSKGGLQYHRLKNECGILIEGKMVVRYDNGDGKLKEQTLSKGDAFHFPPGSIHQEEALEDCVVIEASTPHFNDRVRVEEFYGMGDPEGLPTTSFDDILTR